MSILRIEHPVAEYHTWKEAFDRDPVGREKSGVRRYRILRPIDDPNYVMIDLEFNTQARPKPCSLPCGSCGVGCRASSRRPRKRESPKPPRPRSIEPERPAHEHREGCGRVTNRHSRAIGMGVEPRSCFTIVALPNHDRVAWIRGGGGSRTLDFLLAK